VISGVLFIDLLFLRVIVLIFKALLIHKFSFIIQGITMQKESISKGNKKVVMNLRHSAEVKAFVDAKAAENNLLPSTMYRNIFNAGLKAMYNLNIRNNRIVQE